MQLCLDGPPSCLVGRADLIDPAMGGDGEAFYYNANAELVDPAKGINGFVLLATEAAYLAPGPGHEVTFNRTRIKLEVSTPGAYTVTWPFGTKTFNVAAVGPGPEIIDTQDLTPIPGNFEGPMSGGLGPFLRWDATLPAPPTGFIGDASTPHTVTGGPAGANFVRVQGPTGVLTQTKFVVQGKLQDGPQASISESAVDFGNTVSASRAMTVTNIGNRPMTVAAPSALGTGFSATSTCSAGPVAVGAACTVTVGYATSAANANANATLTMVANTPTGAISVPLHATTLPVASVAGGPLAFGDNKVGSTSGPRAVTLTNTGVVPMTVGATATATAPFTASQDCGVSLASGASCTVSAAYTAAARGAQSGILTIAHPGASAGSASVALAGSGTTPNATLSRASVEFGDVRPRTTSLRKTVLLRNTGDAVMAVGAASATGLFAVAGSDCPATLATAAFCNVAVTFRPAALGDAVGTLRLPNDASPGGGALVALHGAGSATGGRRGGPVTATIRWRPPLHNGGAAITRFKVSIRRVGSTRVVTRAVSARARSLTVKNLVRGARYQFYVHAVNIRGTSRRSALSHQVLAR